MEPRDPTWGRRFRCYRGLSMQTYMIRGLALLVAGAQAVVLVAARDSAWTPVVEPPAGGAGKAGDETPDEGGAADDGMGPRDTHAASVTG